MTLTDVYCRFNRARGMEVTLICIMCVSLCQRESKIKKWKVKDKWSFYWSKYEGNPKILTNHCGQNIDKTSSNIIAPIIKQLFPESNHRLFCKYIK